MAVPLVNTFEGGSDGTTISVANSGGASGNAFTSVTVPATHTLTYETSPVVSQTLCALFTPGGTSGFPQVVWESAAVGTIGPTIYTRHYFHNVGAFLTSNNRFMQLNLGGTQRCTLAVVSGQRRFTWTDASDSLGTNSTMQMSQDTTYRFECVWTLSATVGRAVINCYLGNSTTPLETLDSTANQAFGGTTMDQITFGSASGIASANTSPFAIDGLGIGTTGPFGPIEETPQNVVAWIGV